MAIDDLLWACRSGLENLLYSAQEAHDAAATDFAARTALLDGGDLQDAASGQDDVTAMIDEVRQTIEDDRQRSDADQQELERAAQEWYAALDALRQLMSDD